MSGLSLSMIVRDEQEHLGRILSDLSPLCDEIVIVDTGSSDDTIAIAESFGAKIFHFEWINDFAKARNFSLAQCTGEWIMWVDADDRVVAEAQDAMRNIRDDIMGRTDIDAVFMPYLTEFASDNPQLCRVSVNRERFVRRASNSEWSRIIHESIAVDPKRTIYRTDAWVEHRPLHDKTAMKFERNLAILQDAIAAGDDSASTRYYLGAELATRDRKRDAIAIFEEMLKSPLTVNERYETMCSLAETAGSLGDIHTQVDTLSRAIAFDPKRAKAFILLGIFHYNRNAWSEAMPFFAAATVIERPALGVSFILEPAYSWLPWDYLAVCASHLGEYELAMEYATRALSGHPERDRIVRNARFFVEQIVQKHSPEKIDELMRIVEHG